MLENHSRQSSPNTSPGCRTAGLSRADSCIAEESRIVAQTRGRIKAVSAELAPCNDTMKVQLHLAADHAPHALYQAMRLVIFLTTADDLFKLDSGGHGERRLVNNLVSGIELRHDEMAGCSI